MDLNKFVDCLNNEELVELILILKNKELIKDVEMTNGNRLFKDWFFDNQNRIPKRMHSAFLWFFDAYKERANDKTVKEVTSISFLSNLRLTGKKSINEFYDEFPELNQFRVK